MSLAEHFLKMPDGKSHGLRFGHATLLQIEKALDLSLSEITVAMSAGKVGVTQCAAILAAGINSFNRKHGVKGVMSQEAACDLMDELGTPDKAMLPIIKMFAESMESEEDAAETTEETAATQAGPKEQTGGE